VTDRIQGTVLIIRRTVQLDFCTLHRLNTLAQFLHQPGLANARFTTHEHHLPQALLDLPPAVEEQRDFGSAPHEGSETPCYRHRKATPGAILLYDTVDDQGDLLTWRRSCLEYLTAERTVDQMIGLSTDQHCMRERMRLEVFGHP